MERRATAEMSFINGSLSEKTVGCNNNMREREPSFPSYLTSSHPDNRHHHYLARCTIVDDSSELSIFDAKKYFNEVSANNINKVSPITSMESMADQCADHPAMVSKFSAAAAAASASVDGYRSYRARSFHSATPTASSEASWNSQTGLLSNPPGAISVSVLRDSDHLEKKPRKPPAYSSTAAAKWIFRSSKCPCSGKKSVQVQESKVISDQKTSPPYINNPAVGHSQPQSESPPDLVKTSISVGENTMLLHSDNDVVWSAQRRFLEQPAMADVNSSSSQVRFPQNLLLQGQTTQRVMASGRPFNGHQNISCALPASGFTFPVLKNNSDNGDFPVRGSSSASNSTALIEDPPRDSLEVFKPSSGRDGSHNQIVSFTLRGSPKSRILASAAASGATIVGDIDDVASDASSDLFEIESFSTQTTSTATYPVTFHRRDSLEEARRLTSRRSLDEPMTPSSIAPTDWYEPSEASIDWSVTTAEGFDRASVTNMSVTASEAEEFSATMRRPGEAERSNNSGNNNNNSSSRRRSSSGNGLLSCRSEKAVSVGPHPVKFITEGGDRDRSKGMKHVVSRPPLGKKPPLARSHSARLSLTFAA